jgi:hypothetical protein
MESAGRPGDPDRRQPGRLNAGRHRARLGGPGCRRRPGRHGAPRGPGDSGPRDTAANAAGGGLVVFPAGSYLAGGSIHMLSNVTLDLEAGSTILGAGASMYTIIVS